MKNAFSRIGRTCAQAVMVSGLMAGAMFAAAPDQVNVTLPHAITVGSTTLPSGEYTISNLNTNEGDDYFLVRSADGHAVTMQVQKIDSQDPTRTQVVLSKDGNAWHLDKMFIQGESAGYQFVNA
jgi:hypothetical protein